MGTVSLQQGAQYRCRIDISYPGLVVSEGAVTDALAKEGFYELSVWLDPDELPADWPADRRSDRTGSGHSQAWVQGRSGKPTGQYPAGGSKWQIIDIWLLAPTTQIANDNTSCLTDGYTCFADGIPCCSGNCADDGTGVARCQAQPMTQSFEPPKDSGGAWMWWVAGAAAAAVTGYVGWRFWRAR